MTTVNVFGFLIDDSRLVPEWNLFPLCVCLPAMVILVSWTLINWKPSLVVIALLTAFISGFVILHEFAAERTTRVIGKQRLNHRLELKMKAKEEMEIKQGNPAPSRVPNNAHWEAVSDFDTIEGIPPETARIRQTLWFAVLIPFPMIAAFYLAAKRRLPGKPIDGVRLGFTRFLGQ